MDLAITWTLRNRSDNPGIAEGDMFLCSDPWIGGGLHQNDAAILAPVFHDGKLFGSAWGAGNLVAEVLAEMLDAEPGHRTDVQSICNGTTDLCVVSGVDVRGGGRTGRLRRRASRGRRRGRGRDRRDGRGTAAETCRRLPELGMGPRSGQSDR